MSPDIRYFRAVAQADYRPDPNAPEPHLIYRQEPDGRTLTRIDATAPLTPVAATAPVIEAFGPAEIKAGYRSLTLWMKASVVRSGMVILWNGHPLDSAVDPEQKVVTAAVPESLLAEPGAVQLVLRDPVTNQESAAVRLDLR